MRMSYILALSYQCLLLALFLSAVPFGRTAARPYLPNDVLRIIERMDRTHALLALNDGKIGRTLCQAAAAGGIADVRLLLHRGASVTTTEVFSYVYEGDPRSKEWTPLVWAAANGHAEVVTALLDDEMQGPFAERHKDQALSDAAFSGHLSVVRLLLARGANVEDRDTKCLCMAAMHGREEVVRALLDAGANVNASFGWPLRMASKKQHAAVEALLLERGAQLAPGVSPSFEEWE